MVNIYDDIFLCLSWVTEIMENIARTERSAERFGKIALESSF